ncbi:MAG TPA: glutamate-cysteine ligase family protein [Gemmatimonadaceae bacterium]
MSARPDAVDGALERAIHAACFAPGSAGEPPRLGAEAEVIPVLASGRVAPIDDGRGGGTLAALRRLGAERGWTEHRTCKGTPAFALPDGGAITFEPGGQIEYGAPPARSASALAASIEDVIGAMRDVASGAGIELLAVGIDPVNRVEDAPLQLRADRYVRMAEYFATIGPCGARMMRQTAALQVSLDRGPAPAERWRLLNALAPWLVALFATSPRYAGADTGFASYRSAVWRGVDERRTGIFPGCDPAREYARFALEAPAMLLGPRNGAYEPFAGWLARGEATRDDWDAHLTTLFPEVRPRGYLEVRSCDALPPERVIAPLVFLSGLAYHEPSTRAALELLGDPDAALLARAAREGGAEPTIARVAPSLVELAVAGARALGAEFVRGDDVDRAREILSRPAAGSPGH